MEIPEHNVYYPSLAKSHCDQDEEASLPYTASNTLIVDSSKRFQKPRTPVIQKRIQFTEMEDDEGTVEQVRVYIRVVFLKIGEVNTLKEKYAADVFLQARWEQPKHYKQLDENGKEEEWDPQLQIENVLGDAKEEEWRYKEAISPDHFRVFECRRIKGVFVENLELQHFPFDTQDLSLTISSELTECEVDLLEDKEELSSVNKQSFVDEQEWALFEHVEMFPKVSVKEYTSSRERHPTMMVMCHAARRPGFFVWNIFLTMMLITLLAFTTFAIGVTLTQNRLQLSFTLVLTGVAFKFVVNQSLPRISYLTYMDKYILSSMVYLCLVCVWHSVIGRLHEIGHDDWAMDYDWKALLCFVCTYVSFHLGFSAWIYKYAWRRRRLMEKKDEAYRDKVKMICREESATLLKRRRMSAWSPAVTMKNVLQPT
ncbi:LOW QUALITY PROTEIN: cys-loop ligand-gated ion channel-like [Haliotis rubra]|uniref:LOW QUALITY PROTEIN: cys-loop ligand-gated ion channel-like n=1 Tax=Haliotis rubra TaxID=36100 RepID=UPI001EE51E92|nr:LOW QUALITY PROTEIN: cys-loop ligand-gated ion channel-like [Haliotis rubra]